MVSNVFGDENRPDPFHEATKNLLGGPASPSAGTRDVPFALDSESRLGALWRTGAFHSLEHISSTWSLTLDADETVALYGTYSNINVRPDRQAVLTELGRIAREQFADKVVRNMITCLYVAQRK
jgi:hypothetical protein